MQLATRPNTKLKDDPYSLGSRAAISFITWTLSDLNCPSCLSIFKSPNSLRSLLLFATSIPIILGGFFWLVANSLKIWNASICMILLDSLIRFIKILKLYLEMTYRVIAATFERSNYIYPNNFIVCHLVI